MSRDKKEKKERVGRDQGVTTRGKTARKEREKTERRKTSTKQGEK